MAAIGFNGAIPQFFDANGAPAVGAKLRFSEAGDVNTPVDVFTDSDLSVPWSQPIVMNAAGMPSGPIYLSPTPALLITFVDADDVPMPGYPVDDYSPAAVAV